VPLSSASWRQHTRFPFTSCLDSAAVTSASIGWATELQWMWSLASDLQGGGRGFPGVGFAKG
jgi:hypothetical protein